jgi:hypothetical protein
MGRVTTIVLILSVAALISRIPGDTVLGAPSFVPGGGAQREESLAIVVNRSNPVGNFSLEELRKVFLGERSHWPNGRRITLVMMPPDQPERSTVLHDICHMNESDFSRHFLHKLFTGEVFVSPKTLATPVGVRKFVFNVPGAIGYLLASDVDGSVKVVRVEEHLPEEKDYKLRVPLPPLK